MAMMSPSTGFAAVPSEAFTLSSFSTFISAAFCVDAAWFTSASRTLPRALASTLPIFATESCVIAICLFISVRFAFPSVISCWRFRSAATRMR